MSEVLAEAATGVIDVSVDQWGVEKPASTLGDEGHEDGEGVPPFVLGPRFPSVKFHRPGQGIAGKVFTSKLPWWQWQ